MQGKSIDLKDDKGHYFPKINKDHIVHFFECPQKEFEHNEGFSVGTKSPDPVCSPTIVHVPPVRAPTTVPPVRAPTTIVPVCTPTIVPPLQTVENLKCSLCMCSFYYMHASLYKKL